MDNRDELIARANDAILTVYRAFGRPGDYGYSSKKGMALSNLYDVQNELADLAAKSKTPNPA